MTRRHEMLVEQNADVPTRDGAILQANGTAASCATNTAILIPTVETSTPANV